jgi:uncharacterized membrane protein
MRRKGLTVRRWSHFLKITFIAMNKDRFETFTDAVMAIIMTLMILEIRLPDIIASNIWPFIRHISIYALSFLVIAITWLNHHIMFLQLEKLNTRIIWINFWMLFSMSLIPLATSHLGENFFDRHSHMWYGAIFASVAIPYTLLQCYVNKGSSSIPAKQKRNINVLNWVTVCFYILSIPLSTISIYISTTIFIAFPILYFMLPKQLTQVISPD